MDYITCCLSMAKIDQGNQRNKSVCNDVKQVQEVHAVCDSIHFTSFIELPVSNNIKHLTLTTEDILPTLKDFTLAIQDTIPTRTHYSHLRLTYITAALTLKFQN